MQETRKVYILDQRDCSPDVTVGRGTPKQEPASLSPMWLPRWIACYTAGRKPKLLRWEDLTKDMTMARKWRAGVAVLAMLAWGGVASAQNLPVQATALREGRPAAAIPSGPNEQIIPPDGEGIPLYEIQRIKRTPTLDPAAGLEGNWDRLYTVKDGAGVRTTYFNWDADNLYVAQEMPEPKVARFDLDLKDDGWLRGADNLTVQVESFPGTGVSTPDFVAYRFDTVQNRDQPVWAYPPIPKDQIKVRAGRTPRNTYAVIVAIPRSEDMGLERKTGISLGIRFDAGELTDPTADAGTVSVRPMLRLTLQDTVSAQTASGLVVKVTLDTNEVAQGDGIKATLEVTNPTKNTLKVGRMFLRGYLSSSTLVDESKYTDAELLPGKSLKRELRSNVSPSAPLGTVAFVGGVETDTGVVGALTSFDKVEPYGVTFELEPRPIFGAGETAQGDVRTAKILIRSRVRAKDKAVVTLALPAGWRLTDGKTPDERTLNFKGDIQGVYYKILIPANANPSEYTVNATVQVGGRTYKVSDQILITQ